MMRFLLVFLLVVSFIARGQRESNIWAFGDHNYSNNAGVGLDFNTNPPTPIATAISSAEGCATVCSPDGKLLFYTDGSNIYNRNHVLMPNGALLSNYSWLPIWPFPTWSCTQGAVIVPSPASCHLYYVFSLEHVEDYNGHLYYSVVDMNLNNGLGDVVSGQKAVVMDSFLCEKMAAVKGASGDVWLVVRNRLANEYKSYHITSAGLSAIPVISTSGTNYIPPNATNTFLSNYGWGAIKFTSDGKRMFAANGDFDGGLEMYDFNITTGIVSNAVMLLSDPTYCCALSPDNSKLYLNAGSGKIDQYDIAQPTIAGILSSVIHLSAPILVGQQTAIQTAPNGKIYFSNGFSDKLYIINKPNLTGVACDISTQPLILTDTVDYLLEFPALIIPSSFRPDTISTINILHSCYLDSALLQISTAGAYGYIWNNGDTASGLSVHQNGTYIVAYHTLDCYCHIDTFLVDFSTVPIVDTTLAYTCEGAAGGSIVVHAVDTNTIYYVWKDGNGNVLRQRLSNEGDTLFGLSSGNYSVSMHSSFGCDTTLQMNVIEIPLPHAAFNLDTIVCIDELVQINNTSDIGRYIWDFGDGTMASDTAPSHIYHKSGLYVIALVVIGKGDCMNTIQHLVTVKSFELNLSASQEYADRGSSVTLTSDAIESYIVLAWLPQYLFSSQQSYSQMALADTTRIYTIVGQSLNGCIDTAAVQVSVNPEVFIPSAFTPNGDGRNDYFKPLCTGYMTVETFTIYDRWGKVVWENYQNKEINGWDGTYNGVPAQLGVYYYTYRVRLEGGKIVTGKGDVTLVR